MRRAVLLDRDGVVIRTKVRGGLPYPPESPAEVELDPEAGPALAALSRAGYLLILITNQPDVARGSQSRAVVERINTLLLDSLPITDCFVCYHDDADDCACRKPRPGLILEAARRYALDLAASFVIGDRWRDVAAGCAAGAATIWIDRGYREKAPAQPPDAIVSSLGEAASWILAHAPGDRPRMNTD